MFQYAIGRSIATRHNRRLVLDDLALDADEPGRTKRRYALGVFNIDAELTSEVTLANAAVRVTLVQQQRGFHEEVLGMCSFGRIELKGFWQNERYFSDIAGLLRQQFRMKPGAWDDSPWRSAIEAAPSAVCVHVRRQDYLTRAGANIGFVGLDYYRRALTAMARAVPDARFFVFSDDVSWCRDELRLDVPCSIVAHSSEDNDWTYTDFRLMTLCRFFIVANSSFSWWAAWLGSDPRKIVIAPKIWFRDKPSDSDDVTPAGWLRV